MVNRTCIDNLIDKANFADSRGSDSEYMGLHHAISELPAQYYWFMNLPPKEGRVFGETKIATFDPSKGIKSLRVYHFSEEEMDQAVESNTPIRLGIRTAYTGKFAEDFLTSLASEHSKDKQSIAS